MINRTSHPLVAHHDDNETPVTVTQEMALRATARLHLFKRYLGKGCHRCGTARVERYVTDARCCGCQRRRDARWRRMNPEQAKAHLKTHLDRLDGENRREGTRPGRRY